ncbi:MAG TPA: hypothetical protein VHG91_01585 [Longimicrobium sp.]|nr:hypothetical protein [Longimicrobium sp.]
MNSTRILAALAIVAGAALPLQAQDRIAVGQTVRGALTASSPTLDDDSHYAMYTLGGRSGQRVTVTMRSGDFDAYLAVGRMSGGEFESIETDDDGAGGTDARVTLTFPSTGDYAIRANTLAGGETGAFTLEVAAGGESGGGASGGARGGDLVATLIDTSTVMMRNAGLSPRGAPVRGTLASGAAEEVTLQVAAGAVLAFVGVCDGSCSDLDLTVFGPDGSMLGSDVLDDDAPIVKVENGRAGTYRVRVQMAACGAASCGYGVRAFGN